MPVSLQAEKKKDGFMNYIKGRIREFYLLTSEVENIFISEYMPAAPGEYVKVYLFGLMYAQENEEMTHQTLARQLRISEEELDRAWTYWAEMGVVRKHPHSMPGRLNYDVEFLSLRGQMYGHQPAEETQTGDFEEKALLQAADKLASQDLKEMLSDIERLSGKILSVKEAQEVFSWTKDLGASPEVITFAFEYCVSRGKSNVNYIAKVVTDWSEQGFRTVSDVKAHLDGLDQRYAEHKRILQALGMNRGATEAEKKLMNTWMDEMHFNMERILEACGRTVSISNPNLRYVNKILENWQQEAGRDGRDVNKKVTVTQTVLNKYYEFLRRKAEKEAQERREEIYKKIPQIEEIDRTLNELGSSISRCLLSGDRNGVDRIRRQMDELEGERAVLLTENNFKIDYTDVKYSCEFCKDTGVTEEGSRCTCTNKRIEEAEIWQKSI